MSSELLLFLRSFLFSEQSQKLGGILRLKWHYRNDERTFDPNPFWPKSKFNPSKTDRTIELYLSHIDEKLLSCTEIKHSYYNLTREERQAMYSLNNNQSIVKKEADKGSTVATWDKKDYIMETEKQLSCKKKLVKKFQGNPLLSLKLFMILLKKFEEGGTFLVSSSRKS